MAKAIFGAIVADARGKVGGIVFSKNFYGMFFKKKTSPTLSDTQASAAVKNNFHASAKTWASTLTQAQRNNWLAYASSFTYLDKFNNPQHLTGIAAFIQANANLRTLGLPQLPDIDSVPHSFQDIGGIVATYVPTPLSFTIAVTNGISGADQIVVYASTPRPAGKQAYKLGSLRVLTFFPPGIAGTLDITDAYSAKYPIPLSGHNICIGAAAIRNTNGAAGPQYQSLVYI